jgi:hypothetical protein
VTANRPGRESADVRPGVTKAAALSPEPPRRRLAGITQRSTYRDVARKPGCPSPCITADGFSPASIPARCEQHRTGAYVGAERGKSGAKACASLRSRFWWTGRAVFGSAMTMSAGRRSWDLKVQRAGQHLDEVSVAMAAYASRNPYRAVRVQPPKRQRRVWLYLLEMTEEPDPMIPVIIGECLYDLRSALDHLAVAMAPRKRKASAAFPVETTDPWKRNDAGEFVYGDERRQSFTSKVKDMPAEAVEMIIKAQPYQRENSQMETLSLISRLENADKHRSLIAVSHGIRDARSVVTAVGQGIKQEPAGFCENGAEIAKFGIAGQVPEEDEVTVEVSGAATIALKVAGTSGCFAMPESLEILVRWVRDSAIPEFAPFTRPD